MNEYGNVGPAMQRGFFISRWKCLGQSGPDISTVLTKTYNGGKNIYEYVVIDCN